MGRGSANLKENERDTIVTNQQYFCFKQKHIIVCIDWRCCNWPYSWWVGWGSTRIFDQTTGYPIDTKRWYHAKMVGRCDFLQWLTIKYVTP